MIEFNENKIYRVKNFAKHQNIKVDDKIKSNVNENYKNNDDTIKNKETSVSENINSDIISNKDNKSTDKTNLTEVEKIKNDDKNNLKINYINDKDSSQSNDNITSNKPNTTINTISPHSNIPIPLQTKKIKKSNNNSKKNNSIEVKDENTEDNLLCFFSDVDEEKPLGEGEQVVGEWSF